jgi:hypothetical protein
VASGADIVGEKVEAVRHLGIENEADLLPGQQTFIKTDNAVQIAVQVFPVPELDLTPRVRYAVNDDFRVGSRREVMVDIGGWCRSGMVEICRLAVAMLKAGLLPGPATSMPTSGAN